MILFTYLLTQLSVYIVDPLVENKMTEEIAPAGNTKRVHGKCRGRLARLHFDKVAIQNCEMGSQLKLTNLSIPSGFNEILSGLSREVMREQPDDIAAFAALYFEAELNKGVKSSTSKDNFSQNQTTQHS